MRAAKGWEERIESYCLIGIECQFSPSQDGSIGRYPLPLRTTKRRKTTKNNQNCQKIELYGSPTTKELIMEKHSSRLAGGADMSSLGGEDLRQGGS